MDDIKITKQEMDNKLSSKKGWYCTQSGNEYIYDFHLSKYPIIVKVASSIRIDVNRKANKNSYVIRIFAVQKESTDPKAKITGGLIRARTIFRTTDWEDNLKKQVYSVIKSSKFVYDKYRKNPGE